VGATYQSPGTPLGGLTLASDGNFYGTTVDGGSTDSGTIFRMTPQGTVTVLHNFTGADGQGPSKSLVQALDGSLYGLTGLSISFPVSGQANFVTLFRSRLRAPLPCSTAFR
jgi:uncharacterized repeat protein (TIGR03803 family)